MMMIEIIKNVEIPMRSNTQYPFSKMGVRDAFDAPIKDRSRIAAAVSAWSKRREGSIKFTVRKLDENTVRCIRIA